MSLKEILIIIGIAILFGLVWGTYQNLAYREAVPDSVGRVTIKPGPVSLALGLFSLFLCLFFGGWTIFGVISNDDLLFWLLLGPPLTALMGFSTYIIFWTRLRANDTCVEFRGRHGWETFTWDQVEQVDAHSGLGPRLKIIGSRPRYFWPYGYGINEVRNLFLEAEKPFVLA